MTTACTFCIFAFEGGLREAIQQPCRKGRTVILHCNFNIVSKAELEKRINKQRRERGEKDVNLRFDWYVDNVPERSGIAIHGGKNGDHTSGCLLPGDTLEYNEDAQDYTIKNSPLKKNELFNFFKQYGGNGIKINIDFK